MSDVKQNVIDILRTPQLCNLATITLDGKPWTRYVMMTANDALELRSAVCLESRKIKQIAKNPEVHVTFGINDPSDLSKPYVQVQGTASVTADPKEKSDYWFDMLSMVFEGPEDPKYGVLIVEPYRIEFVNPGSMVPEVWEREG